MIRFDSVSVRYGDRVLFRPLTAEIPAGAKAALIGPSGAGKTSALELVPGFRRADTGRVVVDGLEMSPAERQNIRARIAYLPQNTPLVGGVREAILELFRLRANAGGAPTEETLVDLFAKLGLDPGALDRRFEELSGGERRRAGLAAVLSLRRPLLLLDEPTAGLDEDSARRVRELVFALPITVLAIEHDPAWRAACDSLIEIRPAGESARDLPREQSGGEPA